MVGLGGAPERRVSDLCGRVEIIYSLQWILCSDGFLVLAFVVSPLSVE